MPSPPSMSTSLETETVPNVSTPITPSCSRTLDLNYNIYTTSRHIIALESNGKPIDLLHSEAMSIATSIFSRSPSRFTTIAPDDNSDSRSISTAKKKAITVDGVTLCYTAETLPDPPTLSYKTREALEQLVKDWTSSSFVTIEGVGIPLCLWKRVYSWTRLRVWDRIKDQWGKFKFIVGGYKSFSSPEQFWEAMSLPTTASPGRRINFTSICNILRDLRKERDETDAALAKEEYSNEFEALFTYKKCGKQYMLKKAPDVARRYRLLKGITDVYWDKDDQDTDNEE